MFSELFSVIQAVIQHITVHELVLDYIQECYVVHPTVCSTRSHIADTRFHRCPYATDRGA
jgi:hypothetical protein